MKLGCASINGEKTLLASRGTEESWVDLRAMGLPADIVAVASDPLLRREAEQKLSQAPAVEPSCVRWLPVVPSPSKILCVGLNYADHAHETGAAIPSEPLIFNKLGTALSAHEQPILLPKVTQQVDYEAELVVVIGKEGRDISEAQAHEYVLGYACGHDVSARDWQKKKPGGQWLLGKSFDSFAPVGPWMVTADEIPDPSSLGIQLRLNGEVMQQSRLDQLIFSIEYLIAYVSQVCTLQPGDLLFTGTPPGVGVVRNPQVFLRSGDVVEVEIDRIGCLRNPVLQR